MSRKLTDQEIIDRLRRAGIEPCSSQDELPVKLVISGNITKDVSIEYGRLAEILESEVLTRLMDIAIGSKLAGIVFFPTIINPALFEMSFPDKISYKRDRSIFVAENIPHGLWVKAGDSQKFDLLVGNIASCIRKIRKSLLSEADRDKLLAVLEKARLAIRDAR